MSTYSNLKFELITTGDQSGQWGITTNTNIGTAIEQAIVGMATLTSSEFVANVCTLTLANTNAAQNARALCLVIASGAVSAAGTVNVPAIQKPYIVINNSGFVVTVKVSGQTGVAVPAGRRTVVYNNGTDVGDQISWLSSLTLGTDLAVADGGTGASDAAGARTNLGLGTIATQNANSVSITGGTITGITDLAIADGGTGASTANDAFNALAPAQTGNSGRYLKTDGTNTSWDAIDISTADITGTLPLSNGGTGQTSANAAFNALAPAQTGNTGRYLKTDGTNTSWDAIDISTADITGTLPIANGGTGASDAGTARSNLGLGTLATLSSVNNGNWSGTALAVTNGGTGATDAGTARSNLGLGTLSTLNSINNSNWSGTVLSVANGGTGASDAGTARTNLGLGTLSTLNSINNSNWSGTVLSVANGGTGASDAGTARSNLGLGTISTQNSNSVSITGGSITGITDLAVADGGTGASSFTANSVLLGNGTSAFQTVAPGASGNVLTSNGTTWVSQAGGGGGGGGALELISTTNISTNVSVVDATGSRSTYVGLLIVVRDLYASSFGSTLRLQFMSTVAPIGGTSKAIFMRTSTGALATASGTSIDLGLTNSLSINAGINLQVRVMFNNLTVSSNTNPVADFMAVSGTGGEAVFGGMTCINNTDPVQGIRFTSSSGFLSGGQIKVYGIKA